MNASETETDHTVDPRTDEPPCPNCETDLYVYKWGNGASSIWVCGYCGVEFDE